jgi:hypothetical protein
MRLSSLRSVHFRKPASLSTAVGAAALSGLVGGLALGAMVGPVGIFAGVGVGIVVGVVAGLVIDKDERLRAKRTRELDAIIGVTEGSLGAGEVPRSVDEDPETLSERERWVAEWLTPPPPSVAGST